MHEVESYMRQKGVEYRTIDKSRAARIYTHLKSHIAPPKHTIQVLGTNGKGSTGRFLSLMLMQNGVSVVHFTSPHIFKFAERFYKNGAIISDDELLKAHRFLQGFAMVAECSYFEYATFLALALAQNVDYLILEAGVGGELDSTSVIPREMCVFSVIDYDHIEILGDSIEAIATTKLNAVFYPNRVKKMILGAQKYEVVEKIAREVAKENGVEFYGGNLSLELHSADLVNRHKARTQSPLSLCRFTKNHESQTENPSVVDSAKQNLMGKCRISHAVRKSFCYFWLLPKVESSLPLNFNLPNDADSALDSTNSQNLTRKAQNHRISHAVCKSFCYFWLLPKVESSLSYQLQSTKRRKFAESFAESTIPSPSNSLDSFRKRAAPRPRSPQLLFKCFPKSCRFSLLGGVPSNSLSSKKSAGGTSAPLIPDFLHHETGEFSGANARLKNRFCFAESKSFCYFWLLPKVESSLPYRLQTTKKGEGVESTPDSANSTSNADSTNPLDAIQRYLQKHRLADFLKPNLTLALKALEILGLKCDFESLPKLDLRGRFEQIAPNITIDVGHNQNAALAIKQNLGQKKVILVYNSYFQKNISEILGILKDNIKSVQILRVCDNPRIIKQKKLEQILERLRISYKNFDGAKSIRDDENYLVFGSFSVVEAFLRDYEVRD